MDVICNRDANYYFFCCSYFFLIAPPIRRYSKSVTKDKITTIKASPANMQHSNYNVTAADWRVFCSSSSLKSSKNGKRNVASTWPSGTARGLWIQHDGFDSWLEPIAFDISIYRCC